MRGGTLHHATASGKGTRVIRILLLGLLMSMPGDHENRRQHEEVRAVWVVRTSITSPEKVTNMVRRVKDAGFNTILFQVRGRGDAFYKTRLVPRGEAIAGRPDFDPLAKALEVAKENGLAVHAWVNVMFLWSDAKAPVSPDHMANAHPEWMAVDSNGKRNTYLCPSCPGGRTEILKAFKELATNYSLAGIHLDYIRTDGGQYCWCAGCLSAFKASLGDRVARADPKSLPKANPAAWTKWRQAQITSLVREIRKTITKARPGIMLTAAVWADQNRAMNDKMQDWPSWCKEGLLDAVAPMNYVTDPVQFRKYAQDAVNVAGKTPIWMGIGAWRIPVDDVKKLVGTSRELGVAGYSLFSYGGITSDGANMAFLNSFRETATASGP